MSQTVQYVVYIGGVPQAQAALQTLESSANKTEGALGNLRNTMTAIASAAGLHFGLSGLKNLAMDALEGAADYETAVKRIIFSSDTLEEGRKNVEFIRHEVEKFKIPLQEATHDYGTFLAMLAGSGMASDTVRTLHDNILMIAKIKGLDPGQLSAGVMNLGKMLEAATMDARHLRPLEMQLSGIGKFIADEMGTTVHGLSVLRNAGKLAAADPMVLLKAVEKQAASLAQFLPESTQTLASGMAEVSNAWLDFKNNLVLEHKEDIVQVMHTLKDGVAYLAAHKEDIISTGKLVLTLTEYYLKFRGAMLLINVAQQTFNAFSAGIAGRSAAVVSSVTSQAAAFNALALAMERVAYATEVMAGASLSGAVGLGAAGIPLANAGMGLGGAAAAGAAAGRGTGLIRGATAVAIVWMAAEVASQFLPKTEGGHQKHWSDYLGFSKYGQSIEAMAKGDVVWRPGMNTHEDILNLVGKMYGGRDNIKYDENGYPVFPGRSMNEELDVKTLKWQESMNLLPNLIGAINGMRNLPPSDEELQATLGLKQGFGKKGWRAKMAGKNEPSHKIAPISDKVTGQRIVTYNISIKEINGIKENTVKEGGKMDTTDVEKRLREVILDVLKDSQIEGDK